MAAGGDKPHTPTLADNAGFIELHMKRLYTGGGVRPMTFISLSQDEIDEFNRIAMRLRTLAPHEAAIKKMVVGKR
jgi:hypothetical protein